MAKFTSQEVSALQGGGNASAKEIYFKEWDPQRHSFPDSSNVERLRDFIKHVYVDRRYTGERSFDKPPRVKLGEAEDSFENRRDAYQVGSRSPPYEDTYERRYSERPSPGGRSDDRNYKNTYDERRSPGYDQESRQYGDYRRSPARTEIVNDWRREDRFGSGKRSDDGRISDANSQLEGKSPNRQKDLDVSSPPIVRPVRDILGDNVAPLRIIEPPKANGGRVTDGSLRTQGITEYVSSPPIVRPVRDILGDNVAPLRIIEPPKANGGRVTDGSLRTERTASSSSLASSNGNPAESKREDIGTLIDFDAVPEPSTIATVPPQQQTGTSQLVVQPTTSSNADNWACFDSPTVVKVTQAPSNANPLGLVLSELSVPASLAVQTAGIPGTGGFPTTSHSGNSFGASPVGMPILSFGGNVPVAAPVNNLTMFPPVSAQAGAPVGYMTMSPFGVGAPAAATANNLTTFPSGGAPTAAPGSATAFPSNGGQWPMLPQQPSLFPATGFQSTAHTFTPPVSGPSSYQPWNSSIAPNTQGPPSIPAAQTSQAVSGQPSPPEVKPSGRKELPEDLFAPTYPSSAPYSGWQTGPPQGYGFNMQYNPAVSMQMFPHSSKSTNPFDVNNEVSPVQASTFPSMASLQGALPNMPAQAGVLRTSSLGTPTPAWMLSQSNYPPAMPPQAPSFASAMPPSAYMGQQLPNNMPPRQQPVVGAFGPPNPNQHHHQLGGIYSAPATPNTYSAAGGNPFG
ncbi:NSP (nuclear shuttle protein)-interacting GTPase [Actinidia rufa]|uniref:NSP (Nuclear shuttle protein)-interacting GTPase n=1 Tax=Actinidia rufa TaxID=165716 RepID=A0A7J0FCZ8_9ERIC|nr:NSP (nuclear shuttle protein)-interacting GTPase [Actinidia rufa]